MQSLFDDVYRILPTKITPTKYSSLFAVRPDGNLLFSCLGGHSSIEGSFDVMDALGGVALHLLGDMHFAARYNDDVDERFDVATMCSEVEGGDVRRKVKKVVTFPFERHMLASGVEVIPTPGHRPGAVSYLVDVGGRRCLFAGDSIYHGGDNWMCPVSRKNRKTMLATLDLLAGIDFDVLLSNTGANNPVCYVEVDRTSRAEFFDDLKSRL
ncbi:MAG: hypothetical protein F4029_20595 [Gammaproteobacteria bacterium]|nr:hypothetical protein [Gammaproteobacteria bacterium]MYF27417.1 hypothetical protein [Gammaproteobacteria bacterium]MYK48615.1 hypothetical protein [Gammaproteobacteria bacterium]